MTQQQDAHLAPVLPVVGYEFKNAATKHDILHYSHAALFTPEQGYEAEPLCKVSDALKAIESAKLAASHAPSGLDPEMGFILEAASKGELAAYDHAVLSHCEAVLRILDGKDDGQGVNNEPWATVRKRLLALVSHAPSGGGAGKLEEYDIQVLRELSATLEFRSPERHLAVERLLASSLPQPAGAVEAAQVQPADAEREPLWLCYAYGESDFPVAEFAYSRDDVIRFICEQWHGIAFEDWSRNSEVVEAVARFDEPEWDTGYFLSWEFEIGGLDITQLSARAKGQS